MEGVLALWDQEMEKLKGMCVRVTKDMERDSCRVMKTSRHFGVGCGGKKSKCFLGDVCSKTLRVAFNPSEPSLPPR